MFDFFNRRLTEVYRSLGYAAPEAVNSPVGVEQRSASAGAGVGLAIVAMQVPGIAVSVGVPRIGEDSHYAGRLGETLDVETGAKAAELAALNAIWELKGSIGDLARVERLLFMQVFIVSAKGFIQQPQVANGASRAMHAVFGERGRHVRAALGIVSLSGGHSIEVIGCFRLTS